MNKSRRKTLGEIISLLDELKNLPSNEQTLEKLRDARNDLEIAMDEELDCYDNMPDNLKWSARADAYADNADNLTDALVSMEMVVEAYERDEEDPYKEVSEEVTSVIDNCTKAIERI